MIMADTVSFDSLLNTTAGMTAIVNNKKHDDDVVSVTGVDWFTYAGKTASTIYVSGNNFIGFGQNAEQLKIWRRNGAVYYIYRQEGMLASGKRFLKIRVEGYVYYSLTYSTYALKYEVFLIEGQTLFINVTQIPTDNYYKGISSITDGKSTTDLAISVTSTVPISILVKNAGVSQIVSYEKFVEDKYVTGITVSKMPNKTTYYQGELFDSTGLEVSKTYNDGTSESTTDYELSGFDSSSAGTKTITVTTSGKTTTFEISVSEASITAISVTTMPSKVNYHVGKEFDSTGIVVTATASDGNTIDVTKDCTYSGFDSSSPKQCEITVHYGSFTCTFEVTIIRLTILEVTHMPTKTKYFTGETFDSTGLIITAYYDNGTSEQVTDYTLSNPDMSTYGNKTVTVTFDGKTVDFSILVVDISGIEVKTMPTKTEYPKGDVFDTTGLSILVKYTDGTSETITTGFEVSGFDSSSVGEKTITVTYKTHTTTFKVTVYDLSGIRITSFPSKVYYKIGETFDPSGLTVAEVRQDGTEKEITDYDISGFDSSTAGSKTITVSYNVTVNGVSKFVGSDSFQIKITNDGKNPFDDSSSGGSGEVEEEKTEPINVTVHWINGEFADLTNENIDQNTLILQESICSEQYFIFGGCVCNQITFQAHHDQFNGTSEEFYPHGKIEVYIERKGTEIKIFTGEIDSAERKANSLTRNFIAYDYLYKLRNTDIARWYKNQTTDKKKKLTQKQFRDKLFEFLGLEQVSTKLHWDDAYVPDTNNSNEMNVVNILKDLCLQNDRFGWMNRDGKFEYLKLRQNSYRYGQTTGNQNIYKYYNNEEVHLDTFKSFTAKEGRIWFPNVIFCDPDPNRAFGFTQGDYTAQEAYDNNVYYNRNSFFVGNEDWLNYVWDADEYGGISRAKPIIKICYGVFVNQDLRKYYRAQGYTAEVQGNPLNMVGQAVELYYKKQIQHDDQKPTELQWYVHSYIMSRMLKIGATDMIDTYSANNAPFNSNSQQLGKYTPEISGTVNLTRSEMPTISYAEFTDGSDSEFSPAMIDDFTDGSGGSGSTSEQLKKAQLRCVKRIKKADYDALVAAGTDRADTLYFTFEEG
jgi:hypothetical protein